MVWSQTYETIVITYTCMQTEEYICKPGKKGVSFKESPQRLPANSPEIFMLSIIDVGLKITNLRSQTRLPEANELNLYIT